MLVGLKFSPTNSLDDLLTSFCSNPSAPVSSKSSSSPHPFSPGCASIIASQACLSSTHLPSNRADNKPLAISIRSDLPLPSIGSKTLSFQSPPIVNWTTGTTSSYSVPSTSIQIKSKHSTGGENVSQAFEDLDMMGRQIFGLLKTE
ncbi:unnamed protein product [Protopolystoma xenopodis]|uniref:Uncharacterized protein n=1 Tax=Protopolystoma xenopodis TaxID=117903 RepID=A0A3S5AML0_9PLAT|nr:unnamed protein product [Protopolystoma xenopodis]